MEEVDNIVLIALRQIGVGLAPEIRSIKEFSVEDIVESVAKGLKIIDPSREYSTRLPKEMSARYRVCSTLATACQQFGFRGDLGYHQFLYPTESETRKLLMWVVESLPKTDKKDEGEALSSGTLMLRAVSSESAERLKQLWVPSKILQNGLYRSSQASQSWHYRSTRVFFPLHTDQLTIPSHSGDLTVSVPKELRRYWETHLPFVSSQPIKKRDSIASLFEYQQREIVSHQEWEADWNKNGLQSGLSKEEYRSKKKNRFRTKISEQVKTAYQRAARDETDLLEQMMANAGKGYAISSRFSQQAKMAEEAPAAVAETEEELQKRRQQELQDLRDRLNELSTSIMDMEKAMQSYESNIKQLESKLSEAQSETKKLEDAYKMKKRAFDLLDDPDKNIAMLKSQIDASSKRMLELATQWETHRVPLIKSYRDLKDKRANRMAESMMKLEKIKEFRQTSKSLADEARARNELYKQLVEEYERLPKDVLRSQYTDRIMEIVKNVKKQNVEIDKVLQDTRQLQKEISMLVSTLGRTYAATDELVYREAKSNDFSKKSYKLLVTVHETCDDLIKIVEETGQLRNVSRDL